MNKIPHIFMDVVELLIEIGNNLYRDVKEVQIIQRKTRFIENGKKRFYEKVQELKDRYQELENYIIEYDGAEFLSRGIPNIAVYVIYEDSFVTYDPLNQIFFWYYKDEIYVNGIKQYYEQHNNDLFVLDDASYPASLLCAWFLLGRIDGVSIKNPDFLPFLANYPTKNDYFYQKGLI